MDKGLLRKTLECVAVFYDQRKVGDVGALGFRRSTDLTRFLTCLDYLLGQGFLIPGKSHFLDLGAADGRVNVLLSYLVKVSVGIELNEWTLEEFGPIKSKLEEELQREGLPFPPDNIFLFHGDSTEDLVQETVCKKTGWTFGDFDLFYTYLTMQEEFADLIARKAKRGAVYMVYGLHRILPRFPGLHLLTPDHPLEGILALYQKPL